MRIGSSALPSLPFPLTDGELLAVRMATTCSQDIYDCSYRDIPIDEQLTCADYNERYEDMEGKLWIVILSGMIMCAMAFGMGANDAGKW